MVFNVFARGGTWDPWRELHRIHTEADRIFSDLSAGAAREFPPIEVWSGEEGLLLRAQLPGVAPDKIEVSVVDQTLTLKGDRPGPDSKDGESYHRHEREAGRFVRTVDLPFAVEQDRVQARFADGVLEIELPRAASLKPKKITVKSAKA